MGRQCPSYRFDRIVAHGNEYPIGVRQHLRPIGRPAGFEHPGQRFGVRRRPAYDLRNGQTTGFQAFAQMPGDAAGTGDDDTIISYQLSVISYQLLGSGESSSLGGLALRR